MIPHITGVAMRRPKEKLSVVAAARTVVSSCRSSFRTSRSQPASHTSPALPAMTNMGRKLQQGVAPEESGIEQPAIRVSEVEEALKLLDREDDRQVGPVDIRDDHAESEQHNDCPLSGPFAKVRPQLLKIILESELNVA